MSESKLALRVGIAASVAVHLAALLAGLGYAGFLLEPSSPPQSIAVDLITPQEVAELTKPPEPKPAPPAPEKANESAAAAPPPAPPPPPPPAQQEAAAKPEPPAKQSAAPKSDTTPPPKPAEAPKPATPPPPQAAIQAPEPDISVRYPMNLSMFGSMPGDFDAKASSAAKIDSAVVAAFRAHLKTCSTLPAGIAPDDKVAIVIRAQFAPDGRLATAPILIEASASAKGPLLMQAAIAALQACQPYASLPADKYQEWKMLDLKFTPPDFRRG